MINREGTQEIKMNLHDLNKAVIGALPALDEKGLKQLKAGIKNFPSESGKYYMLLSNERKDYTVFAFKSGRETSKFAKEVIEVLESRGTIKEFDIKEEDAIEIWVDDCFYALFPYDLGVIEI